MAQLVEHNLAKVGAAGSSPVSRLIDKKKDIHSGILFLVLSSLAGSFLDISIRAV